MTDIILIVLLFIIGILNIYNFFRIKKKIRQEDSFISDIYNPQVFTKMMNKKREQYYDRNI